MSSSHPPSSLSSLVCNGVPTDLMVQLYSDRIFVSITQVGKMGTLLTGSYSTNPHNDRKSYDVDVLLGKRDDPLLSIYCRQLVEKCAEVDKVQGRPVLLSVGLKEEGRDSGTFAELLNEVLKMFVNLL